MSEYFWIFFLVVTKISS